MRRSSYQCVWAGKWTHSLKPPLSQDSAAPGRHMETLSSITLSRDSFLFFQKELYLALQTDRYIQLVRGELQKVNRLPRLGLDDTWAAGTKPVEQTSRSGYSDLPTLCSSQVPHLCQHRGLWSWAMNGDNQSLLNRGFWKELQWSEDKWEYLIWYWFWNLHFVGPSVSSAWFAQ